MKSDKGQTIELTESINVAKKPKKSYKKLLIYLAVLIIGSAAIFGIIYGVSVAKGVFLWH